MKRKKAFLSISSSLFLRSLIFQKQKSFFASFLKTIFCEHYYSTGVKVGLPLSVNVCVFGVVVGFEVISLVGQNKIFCNPLKFF